MKKIICAAFCAAVMFTVSAIEATVVSVSGKVEYDDGGVWVPLEEGDTVEKGAVISTGFKSEAVLSVKGSSFTLGPLTRVTLEELVSTSESDNTSLFIDSGSVAADVNKSDGKRVGFVVRSPIATASVRGTQFTMSSSGRLAVSRGLVSFGPSESKVPEISANPVEADESEVASAAPSERTSSKPEAAASNSGAEKTAKDDSDSSKTAAVDSKAVSKSESKSFSPAPTGVRSVPVAKNQVAVAAVATGRVSEPKTEKAKAASGAVSSVVTEAAKDFAAQSVVTVVSSSSSSVSEAASKSTASSSSSGSGALVIKAEFAE